MLIIEGDRTRMDIYIKTPGMEEQLAKMLNMEDESDQLYLVLGQHLRIQDDYKGTLKIARGKSPSPSPGKGAEGIDVIPQRRITELLLEAAELSSTLPAQDEVVEQLSELVHNMRKATPKVEKVHKDNASGKCFVELLVNRHNRTNSNRGRGESIVITCPTCGGQKTVSKPPWVAGDKETWSSGSAGDLYPCPTCGEKGYLVINQGDTP